MRLPRPHPQSPCIKILSLSPGHHVNLPFFRELHSALGRADLTAQLRPKSSLLVSVSCFRWHGPQRTIQTIFLLGSNTIILLFRKHDLEHNIKLSTCLTSATLRGAPQSLMTKIMHVQCGNQVARNLIIMRLKDKDQAFLPPCTTFPSSYVDLQLTNTCFSVSDILKSINFVPVHTLIKNTIEAVFSRDCHWVKFTR